MSELKNISTEALVKELIEREGVKQIEVDPYIEYECNMKKEDISIKDSGPASILIITD